MNSLHPVNLQSNSPCTMKPSTIPRTLPYSSDDAKSADEGPSLDEFPSSSESPGQLARHHEAFHNSTDLYPTHPMTGSQRMRDLHWMNSLHPVNLQGNSPGTMKPSAVPRTLPHSSDDGKSADEGPSLDEFPSSSESPGQLAMHHEAFNNTTDLTPLIR